jgi:hypothetical protein
MSEPGAGYKPAQLEKMSKRLYREDMNTENTFLTCFSSIRAGDSIKPGRSDAGGVGGASWWRWWWQWRWCSGVATSLSVVARAQRALVHLQVRVTGIEVVGGLIK